MNSRERTEFSEKRLKALIRRIELYKLDMADRLAETKRIFGRRVYAVDIHSHSNHSGGKGTIEENYRAAMNAGIDFLFGTDHYSLQQKRSLRKYHNASWGQEPGGRDQQHIGVLHNHRLFRPSRRDFAEDFERARSIGEFAWIPHPAGWYPTRWYPQWLVDQLEAIGSDFAIEVINGSNKVFCAYDDFDRKTIRFWDELLRRGKHVTALGGSDAHCPEDFGTVWTGVFATECTAAAIIKALNRGRCFASESSLLDLRCGRRQMGSIIRAEAPGRSELSFRAADAGGLDCIRIVSAGKVVRDIDAKRQSFVCGTLRLKHDNLPTYYRLETTACDGRRAFSTPIYFKPV